MAKLAAIVAALAAVEGTKGLADELTQTFGAQAEVELADLAKVFGGVESSAKALADAQSQVTALTEQIKGFEPKAARLEKLDGERRTSLLDAALAKAAKDAGIQDTGFKTALKLIDASKIEVDLATGEVKGASKEIFEGLKADHAVLFTPPAQTIPNAPANGGGLNTGITKYTNADLAAGRIEPQDILSGKAVLAD